jgi:hypothetical protein
VPWADPKLVEIEDALAMAARQAGRALHALGYSADDAGEFITGTVAECEWSEPWLAEEGRGR